LPKKKSVKKTARDFVERANELQQFCKKAEPADLSDQEISWVYEAAMIKLHAAFERMVLHSIVGAVNNDTRILSKVTGTRFPKHLTDEVCEYIVTSRRYFNFNGRDGLIEALKLFLDDSHYLVKGIRDSAHKEALERLFALRNFAAHESAQSKRVALRAIGQARVRSSGAWLKKQSRYLTISTQLQKLAKVIEAGAPH